MVYKKNKILPIHNDIAIINKYLHPTKLMRFKRELRLQLNPYSTFRQKHTINKLKLFFFKFLLKRILK